MTDRSRIDLRAPADVLRIVDTLEAAGFSAWAVGGAVRDALASGRPEDWDIATSAHPRQVQRLFRRTAPIGVDHGTVGVLGSSGRMYEVTTFRRDVETFGRKARVAFAETIDEDLGRRDFTINAVAWHPRTREVRDPHGGMRDLEAGVLRTVGDAEQRFEEDRLRVLRALRFAGRFDLRIDERTWSAIVSSADRLDHLSAERVREELFKVLTGQTHPSISLDLYGEAGVLAALYPELERCRTHAGGEAWRTSLRAVDSGSRLRREVRLAALLHRVGSCREVDGQTAPADGAAASAGIARQVLRRLRSSNAHTDRVTHLIALHAPVPRPDAADPELRRWLRRIGREHDADLFRLLFAICRAGGGTPAEAAELRELHRRSRQILSSGAPLQVTELAIGGDDLRALGIPPGPAYGEILRELLERVTEQPSLNKRESLVRLVEAEMTGWSEG